MLPNCKKKHTLANQVVRGNGCDPLWGSQRTKPCPLLVQDPSGVWYPNHRGTYPYPNTPVTEVSTLIPSHWGSVPQYPSNWRQYPNTPITEVNTSIPQSLGSVPQCSIMSTTISEWFRIFITLHNTCKIVVLGFLLQCQSLWPGRWLLFEYSGKRTYECFGCYCLLQ